MLSPEQIDSAVIALEPRKGEDAFRTEDILKVLDDNKDEVSEALRDASCWTTLTL